MVALSTIETKYIVMANASKGVSMVAIFLGGNVLQT